MVLQVQKCLASTYAYVFAHRVTRVNQSGRLFGQKKYVGHNCYSFYESMSKHFYLKQNLYQKISTSFILEGFKHVLKLQWDQISAFIMSWFKTHKNRTFFEVGLYVNITLIILHFQKNHFVIITRVIYRITSQHTGI